jgi:site-specific recombinase XerD
MTIPDFNSALAACLTDFIGYKQALNYKYCTEANVLQIFDQYLCDHRIPDCESIDTTVIEGFLRSRPRRTAASYNHLLGTMLVFFEWARAHKFVKHNPVKVEPRRETAKRIPYVFDLDDAKRLLELARGLPDHSRARNRALIYETVFAILYGLGLRVGEVVRLNLGDIDFARDTLFIRETKFGKSRIVPFRPNLRQRLCCYVQQIHGDAGDPDVPLFSFTKTGRIREGTISINFHDLVPKLALNIPPGVTSPRLHDLRRAFAVRTLLRWYREGIDPNRRLIHLFTFLGHVDPDSTAVYLTITEDLLQEADKRSRALVPREVAP